MSTNTVCPSCLLASYHPKDIEHRFCAACSVYYEGHEVRIEEINLTEKGSCALPYAPEYPCERVHYHVNNVCLEIHREPDGTVHALIDDGDTTMETSFDEIPDWWSARQMGLTWASQFVTGPER